MSTPDFHDVAATILEDMALKSNGNERSHFLSMALLHRLRELQEIDRAALMPSHTTNQRE